MDNPDPTPTTAADIMRATAMALKPEASPQALEDLLCRARKYRNGAKASPPPNLCPACKGLEVVKDVEAADDQYPAGRLIPCSVCTQGKQSEWYRKHCGLEGKMLDLRIGDWGVGGWTDGTKVKQREQALDAMQWFIAHPQGFCTFFGDFGSGKSTAMSIICNELREQMIETLYAPLSTVLDYLRNQIGAREDSGPYWNRLLNVPVLALDEVTRFNATRWAEEKLFLLVETRYRRRDTLLTLFATNDDPKKELPSEEAIGYLLSRMREGDNGLIELRGDMRPAVVQKKWM